MIYGFDSRVRYSQVDLDLKLTLSSVVDYFQDCSIFHSEAVGLGVEHLADKNRAWMLSAWQIVPRRFPKLGENIRIETWPYDFKGFYGYRNFTMRDGTGERIMDANSLWIYMDTTTGFPVKVDPEEVKGYIPEEKLDMDYCPRKLPVPEEMEELEGFQVLKYQLDTNHHVNNAQYIKMAEEYLPEGFEIGQFRAEYKKAAKLSDTIVPQVARQGKNCTVALADETGRPYAVMIFEGR